MQSNTLTFPTTITQKGQITIPKKIREILGLSLRSNLNITLINKRKKTLQLEIAPDFLMLGNRFLKHIPPNKRKIDPVKAREYMEEHYERV